MGPRDALTEVFFNDASITADNKEEFSKKLWMINKTNSKSFRLSSQGFLWLTQNLQLTFYELPLDPTFTINSKFLINLDRYMTTPYYLTQKSIIVFSEKSCVTLTLVDIQKFVLGANHRRAITSKT